MRFTIPQEAHPGEYLYNRFLRPLGLSGADLARGCDMSRSRVSDLLAGRRAITADTARRLGAFFSMDPLFWMQLQAAYDLRKTAIPSGVVPHNAPGFLLGPEGATPIPLRRRRPIVLVPVSPLPKSAADRSEAPAKHEQVTYADGTRALVAK
jgi:addiction module HigA family antidote